MNNYPYKHRGWGNCLILLECVVALALDIACILVLEPVGIILAWFIAAGIAIVIAALILIRRL